MVESATTRSGIGQTVEAETDGLRGAAQRYARDRARLAAEYERVFDRPPKNIQLDGGNLGLVELFQYLRYVANDQGWLHRTIPQMVRGLGLAPQDGATATERRYGNQFRRHLRTLEAIGFIECWRSPKNWRGEYTGYEVQLSGRFGGQAPGRTLRHAQRRRAGALERERWRRRRAARPFASRRRGAASCPPDVSGPPSESPESPYGAPQDDIDVRVRARAAPPPRAPTEGERPSPSNGEQQERQRDGVDGREAAWLLGRGVPWRSVRDRCRVPLGAGGALALLSAGAPARDVNFLLTGLSAGERRARDRAQRQEGDRDASGG